MEDLELSPSFWKDRRVLITGHTGFKGGWLSIWLQRLDATVAGYALPASTEPNLFDAARVAKTMTSVTGDVRDLEQLSGFVSEYRPEVIFHMAAQSLVRRSYADPVETYGSNVMGTVHVLEAARRCRDVRVVMNVTSDKCYENREWPWGYRENEPMGGHDPYSSSKGCAELITSAYRRSYFSPESATGRPASLALASARAGNVIGGGDWAEDRLVPDVVRAFVSGEAAVIRNPVSVRPWQHVLEPLRGYLKLAERLYHEGPRFAEAWNFGPSHDDARPVGWLVDRLCTLWGSPARWEHDAAGGQPHEAYFLKLDCSKASAKLGWRPSLGLEDALRWTVDWYKCFEGGGDVRALTEEQIARFESGKRSV
ncbi:MAG: CDP-glucose 4,6-dehydratase [Gammaproteobacteria bacterium]|nr:MAG: CDP-glucose 4,6-dehydratase [Gammaproteobacteria bacterium]